MFEIDGKLISLDIVEKNFFCNLKVCRGHCCVQGSSGAPLTDEETQILDRIFETIRPRLTAEGVSAIEAQGKWIVDRDGDKVTTLVDNGPCAYAVDDGGIVKCAIEMAWRDGEVDFQKPISCHLYPIRLTKVGNMTGVEYHRWDICHSSRQLGKKLHLPLYKFLKEPLIRRFGQAWYDELCLTADEWNKAKNQQ